MEIMKQNGTVAVIMEGGQPTVTELSELAPLIKIAESILKQCKDHIKARLEGGEAIEHCKLKKGAERRSIPDANAAFWKLRDELGEQFDKQAWLGVPKVSATDAEKFIVSCGIEKKSAKTTLATMLGDNLKVSTNSASLEIK
jgi:hypothetical protein